MRAGIDARGYWGGRARRKTQTESALGRAGMTPRLLRAYRATTYRAAGIEVQVGRRCPAMDALLNRWAKREAAFVGATNPFSTRKPDGWNRRMHAALCATAHCYPSAPGEGVWRRWREPNILLGAPPAVASVLARRFRQAAIIVVARGRPARLALLLAPTPARPCASPAAP